MKRLFLPETEVGRKVAAKTSQTEGPSASASSTTQQGAAGHGASESASGSLTSSISHLHEQLKSDLNQKSTAIKDLNVILTILLQPQQLSDRNKRFGCLITLRQYQKQLTSIRKKINDFKKQREALVKKEEQNAILTLSNMADSDDSSRPAPAAKMAR